MSYHELEQSIDENMKIIQEYFDFNLKVFYLEGNIVSIFTLQVSCTNQRCAKYEINEDNIVDDEIKEDSIGKRILFYDHVDRRRSYDNEDEKGEEIMHHHQKRY